MSYNPPRFPVQTALGRTCNLHYSDGLGDLAWDRTCNGETWLAVFGLGYGRQFRPKNKRAAWVLLRAFTCLDAGEEDWQNLVHSLWQLGEIEQKVRQANGSWQ